jgi:putative FmdB family regulatory protein
MPLYEYQCDACAHRFEVIQKFSDAPITVCPKCAGTVHKLVSSPAFHLKGSGWYATDYAKKPDADKSGKTEAAAGESKGTKETKETKESGAKDSGAKETSTPAGSDKPAAPASKPS